MSQAPVSRVPASPAPIKRAVEVLRLIESAREYTVDMLSHVDPADWFRMPHEGVTHVA